MTTTTKKPNWKQIKASAFIKAVAWLHTDTVNGKPVGMMQIVMSSGSYVYYSVPLHIYAAFHRSASKGAAYNSLIKGRYTALCVNRTVVQKPKKKRPVRKPASQVRADRMAFLLFDKQAA